MTRTMEKKESIELQGLRSHPNVGYLLAYRHIIHKQGLHHRMSFHIPLLLHHKHISPCIRVYIWICSCSWSHSVRDPNCMNRRHLWNFD